MVGTVARMGHNRFASCVRIHIGGICSANALGHGRFFFNW
jgi:hypothetical protein